MAAPDEMCAVPGPVKTTLPKPMTQFIQIIGALLVLAGFLAAQADLLDQRSYTYLIPNAIGSAAMTVTGVLTAEWGFVFLEAVWALVSLWGITERLRGRTPRAAH